MVSFKIRTLVGFPLGTSRTALFLMVTFGLLLFAASPAFAAGGACPATWNSINPNGASVSIASYAGISSCYYISSANGSDSAYDGTSETVSGTHGPFAHLPGMANCTSNCAAVAPAAGEGFVLRGGDSWTSGSFQLNWTWGGSSASSQIYIGVDPSWYNSSCGSSWCRPIWNLSGSPTTNVWVASGSVSYWWLDNVEIKGMCNSANGVYALGAANIRASQLYFHGWTHCGSSNNVGFFSQGGAGAVADHNVIDGSDSSKNTFNAFYSYWSIVKYNFIQYVVSGLIGTSDEVHDNWIQNTVTSADGDHCNGFFMFGPESHSYQLLYNNVVGMGTGCPGGVQTWMDGNGSPVATNVGYFFGNVIYNTSGGNLVNIGNHGAGNYGTYYVFNNTVDGTNGGCGGTLPSGTVFSIYDQNNYYIACSYLPLSPPGGTVIGPCNNGSGTGCNDIVQTLAAANAQGYSSSESAPYSPIPSCTPSTCVTLQTGGNLTSAVCSRLSSLNTDAYNACQAGGTAGVIYNSTTHTVTNPNATANARASAWNLGVYQYGNPPNPPTSLAAVVH
jgi:hypothetical protein